MQRLEITNKADIDTSLPLISIIGRPNVGKSTLFNRLIGRRRAITDPTPGVTRDPIPERWLLGNHPVTLVDSGGIKVEKDRMDDLVAQKSMSLLDQSDLIIFMMDCTEVNGEDQMLLKQLRPYTDKLVLVVNKIDDVTRDDLIWNFYNFGYQRVVGISAEHGLGIEELEDTLLGMLSLERLEEPPEEPETIRLAILGKPNTGKSTLTNLLTGRDVSIVSDIAGTTRDVMRATFSYKGTDYTVLDTAGIRRKSKVEEDVEYYSVNRAIKTIDESDVVFLMVDVKEGLSDQDKKIASLIVRRGKGIIIVLNKIDLLKGVANELEAIKDRVRFLFPILSFAPIVPIAAINGDEVGGRQAPRYRLDGLETAQQEGGHVHVERESALLVQRLRTASRSRRPLQGAVCDSGVDDARAVPAVRQQDQGLPRDVCQLPQELHAQGPGTAEHPHRDIPT